MVGHIIGLGDRHTENLLLDITSGECVHVDFDCLFDKGLHFAKPEIVPFRLTPQMVDAMDLAGVDGIYRQTCEVSLVVLRKNKDMLMSVLESFAVDPLVEWTKSKKSSNSNNSIAVGPTLSNSSSEGQERLNAVRERLCGVVRPRRKTKDQESVDQMKLDITPLSTKGQVHKLIKEATSEENLSLMFAGWSPFL